MFKAKKTLTCFALLTVLAGCKQAAPTSSVVPNEAPTGQSEAGGIDGGGGGTLPANPISIYDVRKFVNEAKATLGPLIQYHSRAYDPVIDHPAYGEKLFLGTKNLSDVLWGTDLILEMEKPCYDGTGKEVDGSVHTANPNAICISAARIAPKLIKERAKTEILALIMHELGHKLGLNEAEAQDLQNRVADELQDPYSGITAEAFTVQLNDSVDEVRQASASAVEMVTTAGKAPQEIRTALRELFFRQSNLDSASLKVPFSLFNQKQNDYWELVEIRVLIASLYVDSLDSGLLGKEAKALLSKMFAEENEATLSDYFNAVGFNRSENLYLDERIQRPTSMSDVAAVVIQADREVERLHSSVYTMKFGYPVVGIVVPELQATPFEKFVGRYEVTSSDCKDSMKVVGFEIGYPKYVSHELRLTEFWENGYGDQGGLFNGGYTSNGGAVVTVSGSGDAATRNIEQGDRWKDRWSLKTETLKQTPEGFDFTETSTFREWTYKGAKDTVSTCNRKLQKR